MRIRLLLLFVALFYLTALAYFGRVRAALDGSDSWGYYVHLPAAFIYHDTGDYAKTIGAWQAQYPNKPDPRADAYGVRATPAGKLAVKYPLGVALLEAPFFLAAHLYCSASGSFPADGFSAPYAWVVSLASVFFAVLGLFFLFKTLSFYFSEKISLATTATIALATNLLFFASYTPAMAHPVAFCLVAYLLFVTRRWHERPNTRDAFLLGLTLGLIALVRTQDALVAIVPLLWGVGGWREIGARIRFFWAEKASMGAAGLAFLLALLPQSAYWKFVSGQWWYYGYRGETFSWLRPHIHKGLFSFENGWLIYTPVMLLALLGLFRLRRFVPALRLPILIFLPLYWYVIYSWWCWMYINGFGSRPMIDVYALLAFPLAAWIASQKRTWLPPLLIGAFALLNIFQIWQSYRGILWAERGNWAYYKEIFGKTAPSERSLIAYGSGEIQPPAGIQKVKTLAFDAMQDTASKNMVQMQGRTAYSCPAEFNHTISVTNDTARLVPGDWLRIAVTALSPAEAPAPTLDNVAKLVVDFRDSNGRLLKYRCTSIVAQLDNPEHSLWRTHGTSKWGEAYLFVMVPTGFDAGSQFKTYLWNPHGQPLFADDFGVEVWK